MATSKNEFCQASKIKKRGDEMMGKASNLITIRATNIMHQIVKAVQVKIHHVLPSDTLDSHNSKLIRALN